MTVSFHRFAGLFFAVALAGCASAESERAMLAREALIGMPKAQLLSCAGVPNRTRQDANVEFFAQGLVILVQHLAAVMHKTQDRRMHDDVIRPAMLRV